MSVFVCIECICLYFLQQKLLVALIQTHSARYIQYIQNTYKINQKYNTNTYKYIQIHTPSTYEPTFFQAFFSVCILFCICLYCIYLDWWYLQIDTTYIRVTMCMYVHVLYVCACIFQYAFPPVLDENMSKVLPPQVTTKKNSQVGQCMYVSVLHVCVCIVCMCMYFSECIAPVRFSWKKTCLRCCSPQHLQVGGESNR